MYCLGGNCRRRIHVFIKGRLHYGIGTRTKPVLYGQEQYQAKHDRNKRSIHMDAAYVLPRKKPEGRTVTTELPGHRAGST